MNSDFLHWLPQSAEWSEQIASAEKDPGVGWDHLVALAKTRLDFLQTERLARLLRSRFAKEPPPNLETRPVRLAILGSSTLFHLHGAIRVAALRRGIWVTTYENEYGQYHQELLDTCSPLHRFRPDAVLFALDARHVAAGLDVTMRRDEADAAVAEAAERLVECWEIAQTAFRCPVIQQTLMPVFPLSLGNNEHRLPGSPARFVSHFNETVRERAESVGVHVLSLDHWVAQHGVRAWHNPVLWHRAKQEIGPAAAPFYGDLVGRLLAALQGRSSKCLVLDLDNTIWGGVIGDDGLEGLILGHGSATGEAFLAIQQYARQLGRRGIILAVCSKNDEAVALAAFAKHSEMVLTKAEIACFKVNWEDKASNLRAIAAELNIGLDSLVFVDDSPFERNLVRRELPVVAVPEIIGDDPALIPMALADAGYFESLSITQEDLTRTAQYQANRAREQLKATATDIVGYLRSLEMELVWSYFDKTSLARIVQLINKTNQFNLTTCRYREEEVAAVIEDPQAFGIQFRLLDRFGDNGVIAIVIGRLVGDDICVIDTWVMSCRVLGRQVEEAVLNVIVAVAKQHQVKQLVGDYFPTGKNRMVAEHYPKLGFACAEADSGSSKRYVLSLDRFMPREISMQIRQGEGR